MLVHESQPLITDIRAPLSDYHAVRMPPTPPVPQITNRWEGCGIFVCRLAMFIGLVALATGGALAFVCLVSHWAGGPWWPY